MNFLTSKNKYDRVLVIGDVMLDKYQVGAVDRISPEAPVPVLKLISTKSLAGGAANVAINLAALCVNVGIIGICANDEDGVKLAQILQNSNVKNHLKCTADITISKTRIVSHEQQICRIDHEKQYPHSSDFLSYIDETIDEYDLIVLSDYAKGTLRYCEDIITLCRKKNKTLLVDPKSNDFTKYNGATLLKPNLKEFTEASGYDPSLHVLADYISQFHQNFSIDYLLVTAGADGMYFSNKKTVEKIIASNEGVYDVTGAGDTTISVVSAFWNREKNKKDLILLASMAAGITVSRFGTSTVSLLELKKKYSLKSDVFFQNETIEFEEFLNAIDRPNKKVIFTNGCFDILHSGHLKLLREAKLEGDILVVGLNSDRSVKNLKGKSRPINSIKDRAELISALHFVDCVVEFDEDTPTDLIKTIRPNVLVKGTDYKLSEVIGQNLLHSTGYVKLVDIIAGHSTSDVIKKIKE